MKNGLPEGHGHGLMPVVQKSRSIHMGGQEGPRAGEGMTTYPPRSEPLPVIFENSVREAI